MDKADEMFTKTLDVLSSNTHLIEIITIVIVVSAMIAILIYVAVQQAAKEGNCTTIKNLYPIPTNIKSVLSNLELSKAFELSGVNANLPKLYCQWVSLYYRREPRKVLVLSLLRIFLWA